MGAIRTMAGNRPNHPEIELDLGRYELRRGGRRVKLEKKPMELLIFLIGRRDQLVLRDELVARLWRSDLFVDTERSLNNIVRKVRTALGDNPARPRFVETVVGKGYRFTGPVRVIGARHGDLPAAELGLPGEARPTGGWSERASLAILPLRLLGNAVDDRGISLGFADALIARLGNLQGVDVLPVSTVVNAPDQATAAEIAARLGVRFVVHGAIALLKGRPRISVVMFDARLPGPSFTTKRDLDVNRLPELEDEISKQVAGTLNRSLRSASPQQRPRYSKDPLAYAEFMQGYRLSSSGDSGLLDEAARHLAGAVARDPGFSLAHATLSLVYATRHFEFDPARIWLEKAEFHCRRALEGDPELPEGHVANAFLLWGPSKNFQHLEAIAELRRAIALQKNLPHAYNRLGTILAHIGLLDHAREMYERGRAFHPKKSVSHSIVQVYMWNREYDRAREEIAAWREENPGNKYPVYFAPQPAMMTAKWKEARALLDQALERLPEEPLIISLEGVFHALTGKTQAALECLARACAIPKTFGHAHHSYYQFACILALLGKSEAAFEWLERSVSTGFACWPFFLKDPCLENLRGRSEFEVLVGALQGKYPDHLGVV
jgi:DNA-binding winged helix-turn-helix (wHTH) protein/tetratricopeptide (TPR) repeat protein